MEISGAAVEELLTAPKFYITEEMWEAELDRRRKEKKEQARKRYNQAYYLKNKDKIDAQNKENARKKRQASKSGSPPPSSSVSA